MKTRLLQPILPFLALPFLMGSAWAQTTGISHPDQVTDAPQTAGDHYVMPSQSAAQPATAYPSTGVVSEDSYAATGPAPDPNTAPAQAAAAGNSPALMTRQAPPPAAAPGYCVPVQTGSAPASNALLMREHPGTDDGLVQVQLVPHQLNEGFVLRTRLDEALSTDTATRGTSFSAQLTADAGHSGEVMLPAGSVLHGHVIYVKSGHRITGPASIQLRTDSVTLPDGSSLPLHATVSGLVTDEDQHVSMEGAVVNNTHPVETAVAIGSVTGAATIMGAALGGGVGAGVGALVGASAGTLVWLKQPQHETIPAGTGLYFSLDAPLEVASR